MRKNHLPATGHHHFDFVAQLGKTLGCGIGDIGLYQVEISQIFSCAQLSDPSPLSRISIYTLVAMFSSTMPPYFPGALCAGKKTNRMHSRKPKLEFQNTWEEEISTGQLVCGTWSVEDSIFVPS